MKILDFRVRGDVTTLKFKGHSIKSEHWSDEKPDLVKKLQELLLSSKEKPRGSLYVNKKMSFLTVKQNYFNSFTMEERQRGTLLNCFTGRVKVRFREEMIEEITGTVLSVVENGSDFILTVKRVDGSKTSFSKRQVILEWFS